LLPEFLNQDVLRRHLLCCSGRINGQLALHAEGWTGLA